MQYSKKTMTTVELMRECSFSKWYLHQMAHVEGQTYATKLPGGRKIFWDTEKFERARQKMAVR
ncbi:hypothetical protein IMSAGC019_02544 [Lachnospiraceae bacterium]|nr:hypothetical protein IMSAGC019_02544 [Lachnospiraceae bacterium]